jgi:hypothetical protein
MTWRAKRENVERAAEDLRRRTLPEIPRSLDRLIYLASMRDYNTGLYYHDGLAARFTQEAACEALADCHREAFRDLLGKPLKELVAQMEAYVEATGTSPFDFVTAWTKLEPYRVAVPVQTDSLSSEFLFSNFRLALAILEVRLHPARAAASA